MRGVEEQGGDKVCTLFDILALASRIVLTFCLSVGSSRLILRARRHSEKPSVHSHLSSLFLQIRQASIFHQKSGCILHARYQPLGNGHAAGESTIHLLSHLYAQRSAELWKVPELSAWLRTTASEPSLLGRLYAPSMSSTNPY